MPSDTLTTSNLFANKDTLLKVGTAFFGERAANKVIDDIEQLSEIAKADVDGKRAAALEEGIQKFFAKLSREHHLDGEQVAEDYKRLSEHVLKLYKDGKGEEAAKLLKKDFVKLFKDGRGEYNDHGLGAQAESAMHALSQVGAHPGMAAVMIVKAMFLYGIFCSQESDRVKKLSKSLREIIKPESQMGLQITGDSQALQRSPNSPGQSPVPYSQQQPAGTPPQPGSSPNP